MCQFIESIRIQDGQIQLLDYHNDRFNTTRKLFFCVEEKWDLKHFIRIPEEYRIGIVKCRLCYDIEITEIQFAFYNPRTIEELKLVPAQLNYAYKSADRTALELLTHSLTDFQDALIVKDGKISDTSYSNIIFRKNKSWYTPNSPLLKGVMREYLLDEDRIKEIGISPKDLRFFDAFMLINAMLPFDPERAIAIKNIIAL